MRILILDTYYPAFLGTFYSRNAGLENASYKKQRVVLFGELFGTSNFYSHALEKLGHTAEELIINNQFLQKQWMKENIEPKTNRLFPKIVDYAISRLNFLGNRISSNWEADVLREQIKRFRPDVLYNQNIGYLSPFFIRSIKPEIKLVVGQIASPAPPIPYLREYDLIISSLPHFVEGFRRMGLKSEYLRLCFEPKILSKIPRHTRTYNATFVGGISKAHRKGFKLLNKLSEKVPLDVWGYGKETLDPKSKLFKKHRGEAWGRDMYEVFLKSKITINRHIDIAKDYANNMRLFEATGCGALLITDDKKNVNQFFEVGKEVVVYKNIEDLIKKIKYYLNNDKKREKIAKAGQRRTLKDHTYRVRMKELVSILEKYY